MSPPISLLNTLTILNIDFKRSGHYYCYGTQENSIKPFLDKVELRVYGELSFMHFIYYNKINESFNTGCYLKYAVISLRTAVRLKIIKPKICRWW